MEQRKTKIGARREEEMMETLKSLALFAVLTTCLGAPVAAQERGDRASQDSRNSYFHQRGYTRLNIPKGHYPPHGECRIWFPDRPPGQQPPPGRCDRVPPGAWLIRHPHDDVEHVHVIVYDERRPRTILAVGQFKIGSGVFVRIVVDR
jgi:hypothetical protein